MTSVSSATATGLPKTRRSAKPLLRFAIPLPPRCSVRQALEAQVEALIERLDAMDPDPDREPQCEDEGAQCEDEGAVFDDEPSLGSLDHINQEAWSGGNPQGADLEVDFRGRPNPTAKTVQPYAGIRNWHEKKERERVAQKLREIVDRVKGAPPPTPPFVLDTFSPHIVGVAS